MCLKSWPRSISPLQPAAGTSSLADSQSVDTSGLLSGSLSVPIGRPAPGAWEVCDLVHTSAAGPVAFTGATGEDREDVEVFSIPFRESMEHRHEGRHASNTQC